MSEYLGLNKANFPLKPKPAELESGDPTPLFGGFRFEFGKVAFPHFFTFGSQVMAPTFPQPKSGFPSS